MAREIARAQRSVCYAAPGILPQAAEAMARVARHFGPELITVCLDFDERVMRMGFGDISAVEILRIVKCVVDEPQDSRFDRFAVPTLLLAQVSHRYEVVDLRYV
jgi:hypothetical protein